MKKRKQSTYHHGEVTPCSRHGCNAPCCELYQVKLLESDIQRLEDAGYPKNFFIEHENNYLYLKKDEIGGDSVCVFQEGSACAVHPHRPQSCRTYPLVNMDGMIGYDEFCPYSDEFEFTWDHEQILQEITTKLEEEKDTRDICLTNRCDACCRDTEMPLTNGDLRRISDLGHKDFFRDRKGENILRNIDHRCFFLGEDRRCTIYRNRPEGCRFYPFILGRGGVVMDEDCPHRETFQTRYSTWIEEGLMELVSLLEEEQEDRQSNRNV